MVVADLVETSRLYGRVAARVEPEMVERVAGHLVARSYSEPHWDAKRTEVLAYERVTLYGLALVARRRVSYSAVDPELCRELFIQHALVDGEWRTNHRFFAENARLRAEMAELEERTRRRDLLVGDHQIAEFYDARIPADVVSGTFDGVLPRTQELDDGERQIRKAKRVVGFRLQQEFLQRLIGAWKLADTAFQWLASRLNL